MNPILSMLEKNNKKKNNLSGLESILKSGNPDAVYQQLMRNNPQFAEFAQKNKNKTVQQIAKDYGIDLNAALRKINEITGN